MRHRHSQALTALVVVVVVMVAPRLLENSLHTNMCDT